MGRMITYDSQGNDITCMKEFDALTYPCKECNVENCEQREVYEKENEEKCINCKFCHTLYTPPTATKIAKHGYCCTLWLDLGELGESEVMVLRNADEQCEYFTPKNSIEYM